MLPVYFPGHQWLLWVWALLLVTCKITWGWANILYGFRFSNLTNRGIVTAGPYRWTKHASYVAKNLSWWISGVPFLVTSDLETALRESLSLFGTNLWYYMRAMAEERHLSQDPGQRECRGAGEAGSASGRAASVRACVRVSARVLGVMPCAPNASYSWGISIAGA